MTHAKPDEKPNGLRYFYGTLSVSIIAGLVEVRFASRQKVSNKYSTVNICIPFKVKDRCLGLKIDLWWQNLIDFYRIHLSKGARTVYYKIGFQNWFQVESVHKQTKRSISNGQFRFHTI